MPKRGKPISRVKDEAHPLLGQISPFKGTELKLDSNKSGQTHDSIDPLSSTLIRIFKTIEFLHTMHAQAEFLVHNYRE